MLELLVLIASCVMRINTAAAVAERGSHCKMQLIMGTLSVVYTRSDALDVKYASET